MTILFCIAALTFLLYAAAASDLLVGNRKVAALRNFPALPLGNLPRVSVIVAARNEERNVQEAVQSLLRLDYPDYEVVVVDDRSDDATGRILDELVTSYPRLKVIHIDQLPPRWLGKNYALWCGSRTATGELFLFTDADVIMEPTVLGRAVAFMANDQIDHLAATPSLRMPTTFLSMFGASFIIYFSLFSRPWKAKDPKSRCHIGIGAFNLVRAESYRKVGGHEAIRLRPDDDLKLGKIIKKGGFLQDVAYAPEFLAVEWYSSLRDVIKGLEKNAFSGADYSVPLVVLGILLHVVCSIWPFIAVFVTHGLTRGTYFATVCIIIFIFWDSARFHNSNPWYVIGFPVTTSLFVFILLRTMLLNLFQGGIYWRGTFYPLEVLKENKV